MNPESSETGPYNLEVRTAATALLGHLGVDGGTAPDATPSTLFSIWGNAQEDIREEIAREWPMHAFVLRLHDAQGLDGLREVVTGCRV
ncbi:hypothetical protein ACQCSX_22540 (plasmid) [Pseudarthrobacter sp. P1]|uniref:hypothetical protein n=1 Tax=Pseudarthrobacter sp. P1 TaxID=3418418 RepID=UPI003CF43E40